MSGALIEGKIEDQGVLTQLAEIRERAENMRPVWANIGQILLESIMRNFLEHRAPDGAAWTPVSAGYARWKSKKGKNPGELLTLSGRLRNSINARPENDSVTIGTNVVYAAIHQFGGTFGLRSDISTGRVVGERTQTLAFDECGRFMSRKTASRRKTGSTRIVIAKIGGHAMTMPARKFLGAREDDWGRISTALEKYIVSGQV
jgi:phage virion morphogenesis protein